jgi:hypothetical protein
MKRLQGAVQATGHWIVHLVDSEDSGILRFEGTGAMPDGMDFALLCSGRELGAKVVATHRFPT